MNLEERIIVGICFGITWSLILFSLLTQQHLDPNYSEQKLELIGENLEKISEIESKRYQVERQDTAQLRYQWDPFERYCFDKYRDRVQRADCVIRGLTEKVTNYNN